MWVTLRARFEDWLFAPARPAAPAAQPQGTAALPGAARLRGAAERARSFARYPYALLRDFLGGKLNIHAMGLVYATLLALVPLVAFSFALLKVFGVHRELEPLIYEFFRPMGDAAGPLTDRVMDFADHVRSGVLGSVGLALLVWTLLSMLARIEDSLNYVWRVEQSRSFVRRVTEYLALLVVAPLLLGALIGMSHLTAASHPVRLIDRVRLLSSLHDALRALTPYLVVCAGFAAVYAVVPNTRVRRGPALAGGVAAGLAWAAVGGLFTSVIVSSARLSIVYAGFAIFVGALIWIYLNWLILLLGAQLSFYVQNPGDLRAGLAEPRLSCGQTEQLALSVMYMVGESHLAGGAQWSVHALAARLALPGIVVTRVVDALAAGGLLARTEDELLLPARDCGSIEIGEILAVARGAGAADDASRHHPGPSVVAQLHGEFEEAWRSALASRTLEAWITGKG